MDTIAIHKIGAIQRISGIKDKQRFIKENQGDKQFMSLLWYAVNPLVTFKVSENTLRTRGEHEEEFDSAQMSMSLPQLCSLLNSKKALDNRTVSFLRQYIAKYNPDDGDLLIKFFSKTLRLGVTGTSINKIIPGFVPDWEIQQAYPIDKYPLRPGTDFTLTQKLNGVRATYYKGRLYARSGVPYEGLDHIIKAFDFDTDGDVVYDGELTLRDRELLSDNEAFRVSTGIINSDSEDKSRICYTVFDALPASEFEDGESKASYQARRSYLNAISDFIKNRSDGAVTILPVLYQGKDQSVIPVFLDQMVREDKEGLMVNLDVPYKCKRHKGILKVKRFYTMDLPIIRCEEGSGRLKGALGAFVLNYKGNEVSVGTGFSDEQRSDFWKIRDELPGTLCEVKYKEISSDKNTGAESLQFPVFVALRQDKHEISFG